MTHRLTRSELVRRGVLGGAALTVPGLLASAGSAANKPKLADKLTISNWPLYIDVDEKTKRRPTIDAFEKRFGVKVDYIEDVNDNEQFFGKIQQPLRQGQSIGRDIVVLTDWMAARLVRLGWLEKLDAKAIPNRKNLQPALQHPHWDPRRAYSLPWQSGMTGIVWNEKLVSKPVTSIDRLLSDRTLKGKVTLLTEMPDTVGLVMLANGDDPSKVTPAAFDRAVKRIQKAVDSGQIRQFTGNDYAPLVAKGDVWAAMAWSGDVVQLQADNSHLRFSVPDTGGMLFTDNMLIPKHGDVYTASVFMNYVYEPATAARIEDYVNYICPVVGARRFLVKQDPAVARNRLIFPAASTLKKLHSFDVKAADDRKYKERFQHLLGA